MRIFVFEDSIKTPSSKLLRSSYNGNNIHFSENNASIKKFVNDLIINSKDNNDNIVIFLDVNPNNTNTLDLLDKLVGYKNKNTKWKDVTIIPIICIEFYIARVCKKYGYFNDEQLQKATVKYLVGKFEWDKMPDFVKEYSLEKIYKRLFSKSGKCQDCLDNRDGSGKFFLQNCNCEDCSLSNSSLQKKAEQLYASLPLFSIISEEHKQRLDEYNIEYNEINLDKVYDKQQNLYNDICDKLGKNRILLKYNTV